MDAASAGQDDRRHRSGDDGALAEMQTPFNVLFLCTGNSARSFIAEGHLKQGRCRTVLRLQPPEPAESQVNPHTHRAVQGLGFDTSSFRSKSGEFARPGASKLDFIFTVCDNAAAKPAGLAWPADDGALGNSRPAETRARGANRAGLRRRLPDAQSTDRHIQALRLPRSTGLRCRAAARHRAQPRRQPPRPRPSDGRRSAAPRRRRIVGTAFLLAAVVGSGIMAERLAGGNGAIALLCNTLPTGAMLTVLILMFGPLSGRAFQPGGCRWRARSAAC